MKEKLIKAINEHLKEMAEKTVADTESAGYWGEVEIPECLKEQ